MQEGVKKNANLVIKLRATFLKVCIWFFHFIFNEVRLSALN